MKALDQFQPVKSVIAHEGPLVLNGTTVSRGLASPAKSKFSMPFNACGAHHNDLKCTKLHYVVRELSRQQVERQLNARCQGPVLKAETHWNTILVPAESHLRMPSLHALSGFM